MFCFHNLWKSSVFWNSFFKFCFLLLSAKKDKPNLRWFITWLYNCLIYFHNFNLWLLSCAVLSKKDLFSFSLQMSIVVESFSVYFSFAILRQQNDKDDQPGFIILNIMEFEKVFAKQIRLNRKFLTFSWLLCFHYIVVRTTSNALVNKGAGVERAEYNCVILVRHLVLW